MSTRYVVLYGPDPLHVRAAGPFTSNAAACKAWEQLAGQPGAAFSAVVDCESWRDVRQFFGIGGDLRCPYCGSGAYLCDRPGHGSCTWAIHCRRHPHHNLFGEPGTEPPDRWEAEQ